MRKYLLLLLFQPFLITLSAQENLVINEIMASNVDYVMDPSFNYGSWIELYNPSNVTVQLSGLYVTDDPNDLKKSLIRSRYASDGEIESIDPESFYCLWFDHHDDIFSPTQMNFKLDYDGGTIYITDGEKILCSQSYPQAIGRVSYARTVDGADEWAWTANPTPSVSNASSIFVGSPTLQLAAPVFNIDGCLYAQPFSVRISSPDGGDIYYTISSQSYDLDIPDDYGRIGYAFYNSAPTPDRDKNIGTKLEQNKSINLNQQSVVIRARAYKDGYLPSEVTTRSYIYKDKEYVFPIVSVATDWNNIYSPDYGLFYGGTAAYNYGGNNYWYYVWCDNGRPGNGISSPMNWNADWDRPVNFEYITADGEYALNQEVDMSMCGGWSRAWTPHSFKLKAAKYYMGQKTMNYPFFDAKPYIRNKTLQIRNGGNDTSNRIIDGALQEVVRRSGLRINTQCWQPAHVFINGSYYAVLNIREPNNKHYAYSNYGYDTDEIDQFEMSPDSGYVQKCGTDEKFLEWYDLSAGAADPDTFKLINDLVDIEEYINYMAVEFYICNKDWPQNNVKGFRHRDDGKFHFVLFDLDQENQVTGNPFTVFKSKRNYKFNELCGIWGVTPWESGDRITAEIKFVTIFLNMLKNDEFRRRFVDTFCIIAGSVFTPTRVKEIVNETSKYLTSGMSLTGGSSASSAASIISSFNADHQTNMIKYLKAFSDAGLTSVGTVNVNLRSNIDDGEIFINDIKVPTGTMSGKVYKPVKIRAAAPEGYKFAGWHKSIGGALISMDLEYEVTESNPRYIATWTKMDEDEMIAAGLNPTPVVINEVSASNTIYASDLWKKSDWIELYNTSDEEVNIAGMYVTDNLDKPEKYQIPENDVRLNTIIPAHGYKVLWCDKNNSVGSEIHVGFKLEQEGDELAIFRYDGTQLIYSDTISYAAHTGEESYGRYPDGGNNGYLMIHPTPGASNVFTWEAIDFLAQQDILVDAIESVVADETGDITIAYVGKDVLNIKSDESDIIRIDIYNTSGALVRQEQVSSTFVTLTLAELPAGMYIIRATNNDGQSTTSKIRKICN